MTVRAEVVGDLVRSQLARDGESWFRATGRSMGGSVPDGTLVRLVAPPPVLRAGDVAMAVVGEDRLVLHRVSSVQGDTVSLQGDTCRRPDPPVHVDDVIAVADPRPRRPLRSYVYRMFP